MMTLWIIVEQSIEWNSSLYINFLDYKDLMELCLTLRCIEEGRQYYPQLIRWTMLQSCAWRTASRCILSEGRCQTRLFTLPLSISSSGRLSYDDLHI
ncbi:unnamed protein product [Schistosoma margrebowiei]|uniref:Uncharacterized protein n=1 Tax=Schistosoma margrebowiei TaxID=48269 RepID=A0A183LAR7_9TREM|nr:unnamed protein product [Schistosoma margrebowiei]